MGKNVVILCDGTGDDMDSSPDTKWTNVAKLYKSLYGCDFENALYISGIGTHGVIERALGFGTGYGIEKNIKEAYKHICRLYKPGTDHIYLFGFSRGAYTVRSLAGFMKNVGLLLKDHDDEKIELAYKYYCWGNHIGDSNPLKKYLHHVTLPDTPDDSQLVKIYFIGIWDSVASLGLHGAIGIPLGRWVKYHQVELPDHVTYAYQALALHELRECFAPVFWTRKYEHQTLEQVWFAGAHADVGGGYDDRSSLADIALQWMQFKASKACNNDQRLMINSGDGVRKSQQEASQFRPHNTIAGIFEALNPTVRDLFRHEYNCDLLENVWDTIKLHKSLEKHWSNDIARDYQYGIPAVNEQLRKIDDRSVRFFCENFSKYQSEFATD